MKIHKRLKIEQLKLSNVENARYELMLQDRDGWELKSKFSLGEQELISGNLNPTERVVGKDLVITLTSVDLKNDKIDRNMLCIADLKKVEEASWFYSSIPPTKFKKTRHILSLKTPMISGRFVPVPCPYYDVKINLNEKEYQKVKRLSPSTKFNISCRLDNKGFEDIVFTYRSSLNSPRVLPIKYAEKITPLVQEALDYFEGDIDCMSHLSGMVVELEGETASKTKEHYNSRSWRRDYFSVKSYGRSWKRELIKDLSRIDKILRAQYKNKLPMTSVSEFYNHIELSAYMGKRAHFIEEISVGLLAKYAFQKGYHLPSVEIQTRSITGNIKACETVCKRLQRKASETFHLKAGTINVSTEEYRSEG